MSDERFIHDLLNTTFDPYTGTDSYTDAVAIFSNIKLLAPVFMIVGGVSAGEGMFICMILYLYILYVHNSIKRYSIKCIRNIIITQQIAGIVLTRGPKESINPWTLQSALNNGSFFLLETNYAWYVS